jgi:hypothetical protein
VLGSSYSWQIDYRQNFHPNFAGSFAYINEGHVPGHHRDGDALQIWGCLPFDNGRVSLSLGAGAYYFYDTQVSPLGGSADVHGTAPIYSAALTTYFSDRWFARLMVNRISPSSEIQTTTASVGLGYWFGQDLRPKPGKLGDAPAMKEYVTENEIIAYGGQSIVNTFFSEKARAYAVEYRRGLAAHLDWTLSGIYEGDPQIIRRNGLATQVWAVNTFFNERVFVGAGLGPYFYIDHRHPRTGQTVPAAIAPIVTFTLGWQLSEHWITRLAWNRVVTTNSRDSDIILLGLGYRWH